MGTLGAIVAFVLVIVALLLLSRVFDVNERSLTTHNNYAECSNATSNLLAASDYLTTQTRLFIMSGDPAELSGYFEEVNVVDRRSASVATVKNAFGGTRACTALLDANAESHSLSNRELYAMRLAAEAYGIDSLPIELANVKLKKEDEALSKEEKKTAAEELVLGEQYQLGKEIVIDQVAICNAELIDNLQMEERACANELSELLYWLRIINLSLLAIVLLFLFVVFHFVVSPLARCAKSISLGEKLTLDGAHELCIVSDAYNDMFDDISRKTEQLRHDAEHDALTGLLNRGMYDRLLEESWAECALVLVDVDHFKEINDEYGHSIGDRTLCRVAEALQTTFSEDGYVSRIGGDEFAVVLVDSFPVDHDRILSALRSVRARLHDIDPNLPTVTLSCGIAFGVDVDGEHNGLYRASDAALYMVKQNGRDGIGFFGDDHIDRSRSLTTPNEQPKE